jgi:hypothetical protein
VYEVFFSGEPLDRWTLFRWFTSELAYTYTCQSQKRIKEEISADAAPAAGRVPAIALFQHPKIYFLGETNFL